MSLRPNVPPYFDYLIEGFRRGTTGRLVHLGYWEPGQQVAAGGSAGADEFSRAQKRLDEALLALADLRDAQSVLDAGCGFGGTLQDINLRMADMRLTGVNIDPRQLDICRQLKAANRNRLQWERADACDLSFDDASFDRVLCIEAMFHFRSRREFFCEAARVLKPGGLLVGSDITLSKSGRCLDVPRSSIEAPLLDGFGPWPDLWGEDADHARLAEAAGLRCAANLDLTAQTLPSHRFTAPGDSRDLQEPGDAGRRAALMLKWLHQEGHLLYHGFRFEKPADRTAR